MVRSAFVLTCVAVVLASSVYIMFGAKVLQMVHEGFSDEPFHIVVTVLVVVMLLTLPWLVRVGGRRCWW